MYRFDGCVSVNLLALRVILTFWNIQKIDDTHGWNHIKRIGKPKNT